MNLTDQRPPEADPLVIRPVHLHDADEARRLNSCHCSWPKCPYPEPKDGYPEFTVVNKRDYCAKHAKMAESGLEINETFKPLVGTGEP